jgi:DNA polymerase-1
MDSRLSMMISDPERVWVFSNAKYDMHMMANIGSPEFKGGIVDIIVQCMLRDENRKDRKALGLKAQSLDFLGIKYRSFAETFGVKVGEKDEGRALLSAPIDLVAGYASLDAYATWLLSEIHETWLSQAPAGPNIMGFKTLSDYFWVVEAPFTKTLWRMERRGMLVDTQYLQSLEPPLEKTIEGLKKDIMVRAGFDLNPNSHKQMTQFLYGSRADGGLGLKAVAYTKSGNKSARNEDIIGFSKEEPIIEKIVRYRTLTKHLSTYVKGIQRMTTPLGRVHCTIKQCGTNTGRLSVEKPGLQQLPIKTERGKEIRHAFIAGVSMKLGVWDYSQMEMCIMAHISQDPEMINAIRDGQDLHALTVSKMLGAAYEDVVVAKCIDGSDRAKAPSIVSQKFKCDMNTAHRVCDAISDVRVGELIEARTSAKAIGFGLMYGKGPGSLGRELGISTREAKTLIKSWFSAFPHVKRYMDWIKKETTADKDHTVYTVFGRPRRLTSIISTNRTTRAKALRDVINSPIQGSASCVIKYVMVLIDRDPELGGDCLAGGSLGTQLLLQIHDELIMSVQDNNKETMTWVNERMKQMMTSSVQLSVPLKAEGGLASSWAEAK